MDFFYTKYTILFTVLCHTFFNLISLVDLVIYINMYTETLFLYASTYY